MARWRRRFRVVDPGGATAAAATTVTTPKPLPPASAAELEREVRAPRRELAEVRQQREILYKKALVIFSESPR